MIEIRQDNVVFLLGAGASYEAQIPISFQMVNEVEDLIQSDWKEYRELYFYLKSCINYSQGIIGNFDDQFNIETLLIVIGELQKRERNIVYPFIGTWNNRLLELAGPRFEILSSFRDMIVGKLNDWVLLMDYGSAEYYAGFSRFRADVGHLIHVFTLNYDLCFEQVVSRDSTIMDGFDRNTNTWSYINFVDIQDDFCLYKLHGSIDWVPSGHEVKKTAHPGNGDKPELIFGVEAKLRSRDPYLFYISQFRQFLFSTDCKVLITIGYSFSDRHINDIIAQALRHNQHRKIMTISPIKDTENREQRIRSKKLEILDKLDLPGSMIEQVEIHPTGAKEFLKSGLTIERLSEVIEFGDDEIPFDV